MKKQLACSSESCCSCQERCLTPPQQPSPRQGVEGAWPHTSSAPLAPQRSCRGDRQATLPLHGVSFSRNPRACTPWAVSYTDPSAGQQQRVCLDSHREFSGMGITLREKRLRNMILSIYLVTQLIQEIKIPIRFNEVLKKLAPVRWGIKEQSSEFVRSSQQRGKTSSRWQKASTEENSD